MYSNIHTNQHPSTTSINYHTTAPLPMQHNDDYTSPSCWQSVTACLHYHLARLTTPFSDQHQPLYGAPPVAHLPDTAVPAHASSYTPPQPSQPLWMSPDSTHSSSVLSSLSVTDSLSQGVVFVWWWCFDDGVVGMMVLLAPACTHTATYLCDRVRAALSGPLTAPLLFHIHQCPCPCCHAP